MADEILVENEPWTGLVVVWDTETHASAPGGQFGLVQASEWHQDQHGPAVLTVWRGPDKPDERIPRNRLKAMDCQTVQVNEEGFYTCPPLPPDELVEEVWALAEPMIQEEANSHAAEAYSYLHEGCGEKYGDDVMAIATFGDIVAVNGESTYGSKRPKIPRGWVEVEEEGGHVPSSGTEEAVELEYIAERIADDLIEKNPFIDKKTVMNILVEKTDAKHGYIAWSADSGETEVWTSKKALKAYEKAEEERKRVKAERDERDRRERRAREEAERQEKMRRGGYPGPKDWSPKGGIK